jgi:hypothetical protein
MKSLVLLPAFLLLTTSLTACGDPDAKLSTATDAQINRAFLDASGTVPVLLIAFVGDAAGTNDTEHCPNVATAGDITTITECGSYESGRITLENFPGSGNANPDYDATKPSTMTLDLHHHGDKTSDVVGTIEAHYPGGHVITFDSDLDVTIDGIASSSELHATFDDDAKSMTLTDSRTDIDGLGVITIDGSFAETGTLTLHGADGDLVIDLSKPGNTNDCATYTFGTKTGQACIDSDF